MSPVKSLDWAGSSSADDAGPRLSLEDVWVVPRGASGRSRVRCPGGPSARSALHARTASCLVVRGVQEFPTQLDQSRREEHPMSSIAEASPFPPIAEYAFLSDCHTGALVAPDGRVDWMCCRASTARACSGLLDRGAGHFRVGPYGVYVPTARRYVPGTNVSHDVDDPSGWLVVRDGAGDGPARARRTRRPPTPARRPTTTPSTCSCARSVCLGGASRSRRSASRSSTTAEALGAGPARAGRAHRGRHRGHDPIRLTAACAWASRAGARGPPRAHEGEKAFWRCPGRAPGRPRRLRRRSCAPDATVDFWRRWLGRARIPDHRRRTSSGRRWRSRA